MLPRVLSLAIWPLTAGADAQGVGVPRGVAAHQFAVKVGQVVATSACKSCAVVSAGACRWPGRQTSSYRLGIGSCIRLSRFDAALQPAPQEVREISGALAWIPTPMPPG